MVVSALGPHADSQRLGYVSNVLSKNISLDNVTVPVHVYQTNGGHTYVPLSPFAQVLLIERL